jgi:hypothetical protein
LSVEVVVRFVDCVEEVQRYDEDVNAPAVFGEAWGARAGFGIAGADADAVVYCLDPACYELVGLVSLVLGEERRGRFSRWAGMSTL